MTEQIVAVHLKTCTKCGECKPATLQYFHSHLLAKGGLNPRCRECRKSESIAYYQANADTIRKKSKKWQQDNPVKANARKLAWAKEREESESARTRKYREQNRAVISARECARTKQRELTDPAFRLRRLMSRRMWASLKTAKDGWSWERLVGYTRKVLLEHLEKQFTKGMSWNRFAAGEIHIDHIIPVSSFNCTLPSGPDFQACWSLANLRPMWAKDNMSKGAQMTHLI
jgi:hypothetical protein